MSRQRKSSWINGPIGLDNPIILEMWSNLCHSLPAEQSRLQKPVQDQAGEKRSAIQPGHSNANNPFLSSSKFTTWWKKTLRTGLCAFSPLSLSHLGCAFSFSPSLSQDSRCPPSPGAPPWTRGCRASPCWRSPCRPSGGSTRTRLSHSPAPCLSSASCSAESNFHSYPMGEIDLIAICVEMEIKTTGKYIADWHLRLLLELLCDPNQKVWSQRIETSYVE